MWTTINQVYATSGSKNCWAHLPSGGWRKVEPSSNDGVTNVHVLLALAKANGKQAHVVQNSSDRITQVYL